MAFNSSIVVILICALSFADECVFFQTEFDSLPDNWENVNWYFLNGARCMQQVSGGMTWEADMHTAYYLYLVPYGSDSVVITVVNNFYLSTTGGSSEAKLFVNDGLVWLREVVSSGNLQSSEDISYTLVNPGGGSGIALKFIGRVISYDEGQSIINWNLHRLTLTAYGDSLASLQQSTWGSLKSGF